MENSVNYDSATLGSKGTLWSAAKENSSGISSLIASVIGLLLSLPIVFMATTAVLMVPITESTGWTRGEVSTLIAISFVGQAIGSAVFGRVLASRDPRRVIALSTLALGGSLIAFGMSKSYILAIIFAASMGTLGAAAGLIGYIAVLPLWFDRRLGLALGIAMLGLGAGAVGAPVVTEMLVRTLEWGEVYMLVGAVVLCVALPGALLLLKVPEGGPQLKTNTGIGQGEHGMEVPEVLRDRRFWQLCVLFFIATAVIAGTASHLTSMMTDRGYDAATAAFIFTVWGVGITLSRFVSGVLLDYLDCRIAGAIFMLGAMIGFGLLLVDAPFAVILLASFLIASAQGMDGDLLPYIVRRCFGLKAYSTSFGFVTFAYYLGATAGIMLFGFTFDTTGGYDAVLWMAIATMLVSTLLLIGIGKPVVKVPQSTV